MADFYERIVRLRLERGLSTKDCAAGCNMTLRAYQYYEAGKREPLLRALISIADFFNVSLDYLVGRSDVREIK